MKRLITYFVLAYAISWAIWLPLILPKFGIVGLPILPKYHHYLGSFGPILAACILSFSKKNGWAGVRELLGKLLNWRVGWVWWFVAVVVPVLLVVAAGFLDKKLNGHPFSMLGFSTNEEFPEFGAVGYFIFNLLTFGIGEETGWRGFALPRLQNRFSALAATFILAVGWASWHIPAFIYRPLYSQMDAAGIAGFFMSMLAGAIVLTWLFNSTSGSLLLVSIFHAMIELMFMSKNVTPAMSMYEGAAVMVGAVLIVLLAKPRDLSRVSKQTFSDQPNSLST